MVCVYGRGVFVCVCMCVCVCVYVCVLVVDMKDCKCWFVPMGENVFVDMIECVGR